MDDSIAANATAQRVQFADRVGIITRLLVGSLLAMLVAVACVQFWTLRSVEANGLQRAQESLDRSMAHAEARVGSPRRGLEHDAGRPTDARNHETEWPERSGGRCIGSVRRSSHDLSGRYPDRHQREEPRRITRHRNQARSRPGSRRGTARRTHLSRHRDDPGQALSDHLRADSGCSGTTGRHPVCWLPLADQQAFMSQDSPRVPDRRPGDSHTVRSGVFLGASRNHPSGDQSGERHAPHR